MLNGGWDLVVGAPRLEPSLPLLLQTCKPVKVGHLLVARNAGLLVRDASEDIGENQLHVSRDTHLRWIVLANLLRVNIDMDQLGLRNRERDALSIGRG